LTAVFLSVLLPRPQRVGLLAIRLRTQHVEEHLMGRRTVVLGLGNPVLRDDAVGLRVVERLKEMLRADPAPGVDVVASTRAGFELIDILQGYGQAIIVDCLDVPEPVPGRVRKLDLENFAGSARLNASHEISIVTAFELAKRLGVAMPEKVEIFAVEASDVRTLCEEMTEQVAAAVKPLAEEIHAMLKAPAAAQCGDAAASEGQEPGSRGPASPPRQPFYPPWEEGG
jgi:hydrogenase maturation protease